MNITEVRVKLLESRSDRLRAFCSVTIDEDFVVHDIRVIEGRKGRFVAMPSRKLSYNCSHCGGKNHLRAKYCNDCGHGLDERKGVSDARGRNKFHVDVAHPINTACRQILQSKVLEAYEEELSRSRTGIGPGRAYEREDLDAFDEEIGLFEGEEGEGQEKEEGLTGPEDAVYDEGGGETTDFLDEPEGDQQTEKERGFGEGIF